MIDRPRDHHLSAELIDSITEAVASPVDPRERADVISFLVHEVDEAVKWRNERHPGGEEEQSLATLVTAAAVHRHRMDDVVELVDDEDDVDTVTGQDFQQLATPAPARPVSP
jgi:hypothetical protein